MTYITLVIMFATQTWSQ